MVIALRAFVVQPFYIPSASMVPQLKVDDKILVSRISYRLHGVHRGDIVVFDEPPGARLVPSPGGSGGLWHGIGERLGLVPTTSVLVKRVIGLPGDRVEGHNNHVYVNGRLLLEPYLPPAAQTGDFNPEVLKKGELWVMGDNRKDSEDSRYFGPIHTSTVIGRAVLRVWPLDTLSFL
jgi:signal peptidase I